MGKALERQPSSVYALGHQDRKSCLNAGDTTPRLPDVVSAFLFVSGGAGLMIGADQVDASREHLGPERLASRGIANRRRALERRADTLEIVLGERQIMGTRLRGHRVTLAARGINDRQPFSAAHMHDVCADRFPRAAHADEQSFDRFHLGGRRARATPRQPLDALLGAAAVEQFLTLRVHTYDRAEARGGLEADREHTIGHARKVVDAAMTHEGLEANYPPLVEDMEVVEVVRD